MSLLSQASLCVTPNAYKEGKLYSVIPSDGSGDFTFTRATTATRVNSSGLVELVPYNLVRYTEDFSNVAWDKIGAGGGIAPVVTSNAGTAPDGTLTAERVQFDCVGTTSTFRSIIGQGSISTVINSRYTQSLYVKAFSPSEVGKQLRIVSEGTNNGSIITITADWQRITINGIPAIFTSSNFNIETRGSFTTNTTADVLLWGAQLVEGTSALTYQKTETRLNIPRLDYSLGGCPNILLEPQRTNLLTYSSSFDNAAWTKINATVTANTTTAPDGTLTADKIVENTATNVHRIAQSAVTTSGQIYTQSVFAKGDGSGRFLRLFRASGTYNFGVFDLTNGVIITQGGSNLISANIEFYGNGWYRCSITFTAQFSFTPSYFAVQNDSLDNYTGDGTSGVYIWGAQLEAGSYATSYIPTTTASVTRNADIVNKTGISSLIGQTEGVIYWEGISTIQTDILGTNRSTVNGIYITKGSGNLFRVFIYNSSNVITLTDTIIRNSNTKIAISYKSGNTSLFVNGVKVATSSDSLTFNASLDAIRLNDNYLIGVGTYFTKSVLVYKTALTNDQLEQLTGTGFDTYAAMASFYNYTLQ